MNPLRADFVSRCIDDPVNPGDDIHEFYRLHRLYEISGIALWYQRFHAIHLSRSWKKLFGIFSGEVVSLEDYLILIRDIEERKRIEAGRKSLILERPGFEWSDTFTLCEQRVRSSAVVARDWVFGIDQVVFRESPNG